MDAVNLTAIAQSSFIYTRLLADWAVAYPDLANGLGVFRSFMRVNALDPVVWYSWASDGSCPGTIDFLPSAATGNFVFSSQPVAGNQLQFGTALLTFETAPTSVVIAPSATVTMASGTPGVITWTAHGLPIGTPVIPTTSGALFTGLVAGTTYYISAAGYGTNSFSVAATQAAALAGTGTIAFTGSESGVQTLTAPTTVLWAAHGLVANESVSFFSTGALAAPLATSQGLPFYVSASLLSTNTFQISSTPGGSVITTTGGASGAAAALGGLEVLIGLTLEATLANLVAFLNPSRDPQLSQVDCVLAENVLGITFATNGVAGNQFVIASLFAGAVASDTQLDGGGGLITVTAPLVDIAGFGGQNFVYDCRWEYQGQNVYLFGGTLTFNQAVTR